MLCSMLPASITSPGAFAREPLPARPPHPADGLLLSFQNLSQGVENTSSLYDPKITCALITALRLSFSTAFLERLCCSLNLIEPHLRPGPRRIPSDDPGTNGNDPRNLYASCCFARHLREPTLSSAVLPGK